ncbi:hypothetical protein PP641_gp095 [Arthrobacter phage SilentRX]|uniref:Uncharacterized protein n=1 Tax=Arthrobacter phage SilentRX TaxID=2836091 RepID=A0A8F3INM6_9CAUD|nr:hypothetical protein PP641_gp095 [Arthrobacter phage SilentRX]QWY82835.1 hypothetical protein SEA_SILENTRX_95 [Arthrobacter phage SilentRX]
MSARLRVPTEGFPLWLGVALTGNPLGAVTAYGQGNPYLGSMFASLFAYSCWRLMKLLAEGGRETDPSPAPELPAVQRKDRTRQVAQHDEWDAAYRRALPPTPGRPVWERRPYRKDLP